jgi:hypothetical protein
MEDMLRALEKVPLTNRGLIDRKGLLAEYKAAPRKGLAENRFVKAKKEKAIQDSLEE